MRQRTARLAAFPFALREAAALLALLELALGLGVTPPQQSAHWPSPQPPQFA